jgi:transposase
MPAPLSNDLRKRIVEARKRGETISKIAREKSVSESAIERLLRLYKETGSYQPRSGKRGRKPRLTPEQLAKIRVKILSQPDISLSELIKEMNLPVCESALCRTVNNKLGLRRKKNGIRG